MELAWFWIRVIGVLLLIGLVPALVVTSMLIKPPGDDDETTPSMSDPL